MSSEQKQSPGAPGIAVAGLWLFLLCILGLLRIGNHTLPKWAVVPCLAIAVCGQGLLRQKLWGWATSLMAVVLTGLYGLWAIDRYHRWTMLIVVATNLVMVLYLIRPRIRARMR